MRKFNLDILFDIVYELLEDVQNDNSKTQAFVTLDKFYLSGNEPIWTFEMISTTATSGRLVFHRNIETFVLNVKYKRDHRCDIPYFPGTNSCRKLFITALSTIKSLTLGDLQPLPDEIEEILTSNPYLENLDMNRVLEDENKLAEFPCITKMKNLKNLTCSLSALESFRKNRIFLKLNSLTIRQTRAANVFGFFSNPCFEAEEINIGTLNLNITPIMEIVNQKLQFPTVKRFFYVTNERELHGKLPDFFSNLLRAFIFMFPSVELLELTITTEPIFTTNVDGQYRPSAAELMENYKVMKEAIKNCEIPSKINLVFRNKANLWFKPFVQELSTFNEDLTRVFPEKKIEGRPVWGISEKNDNVETSMHIGIMRNRTLRPHLGI